MSLATLKPTAQNPIAIGLDIDGTLAASHFVSEYALSVLAQLAEVNVKVFLVTGRHEANVSNLCRKANLTAPFIACGGALVMDPVTREVIFEQRIDTEIVEQAYQFCKRKPMMPTIFTADSIYTKPGWPAEILQIVNDVEPYTVDDSQVPIQKALKVMIGVDEQIIGEYAESIKTAFPRMQQTMPMFFEASPLNASKENSLKYVLDRIGVPPERCIGFGDGENDAVWLSMVGKVVTPSNAYPCIKEIADEIIGPNTEDSVAHYLEETFLR